MSIKSLFVIAIVALASLSVQAQQHLPKTTIAGHEFYYYETAKGESIYDIAAKLDVTKVEIIRNNPDAADGISDGMRLYFPVEKGSNVTAASVSAAKTHTVAQGETLYGLAKRYGTTVEELVAANPDTDGGIKTGQVLTIPQGSSQPAPDANQQVKDAFSQNNASVMNLTLPQGSDPIFVTLKYGEGIYDIAKQYNASIESIILANPGLKPNEYTGDTKIKVLPNTALPFVYERTGVRNYKYEVQRGESYASIAKDNGITEQELKAANPDIKKATTMLRESMTCMTTSWANAWRMR